MKKRVTIAEKVADTGPTVEAGILARLFGLTPTRISQLGKSGVLPKAGRGKYFLWPSIKNYIAELRDPKLNAHGRADGSDNPESLRAKRETKLDLECKKLDFQIKVLNNEYVSVESELQDGYLISQTIRSEILKIPSELPQALIGLDYAEAVEKCEKFADHMIAILHDCNNYEDRR